MSDESGVSYGARLVATLIVCGMAVGSVALWIGNPIFWFWLTGRLQGTQATMGPYALLIIGILATAVACAKLLALLNRRYATVMGDNTVNVHCCGRAGSGANTRRSCAAHHLGLVMVLSVVVAAIALIVWFIVIKPTPPGVGPGGFKP